jgi:hypothetical protein
MDNNTLKKTAHRSRFIFRLTRSILMALCFIIASLFLGMWGYRYFESMGWLDAYVNAAMILSGMGPLAPPKTDAGKLFEGTYALFSGIIFLVSVGVILAPLLHHFFHKLQIEESEANKNQ